LHISEENLAADYAPLLQSVNELLREDKHVTSTTLMASSEPQQLLSSLVMQVQLEQFAESRPTPRERHVVDACAHDGAAWLEMVPTGDTRFMMTSEEWRIAARFRLGKAMYSRPIQCPCCHNQVLDVYGIHGCTCQSENDCRARHDACRNALYDIAKEARLSVALEPNFLLSDTVAGDKPADVIFYQYGSGGRHACVDVTIANSLEDFSTRDSPWKPSASFVRKANDKNRKYLARCSERGFLFVPFVCGSLGGFGEEAMRVIKKVGRALGGATGILPALAIDIVRRRLAFVIQKAQATSILRRGHMGDVMMG